MLPTRDSPQFIIHTQSLKIQGWKKVFHGNGNKQNAGVAILIPHKLDFKTEGITREKEGPSNFISGYLSEETQNTKLKKHMHSYVDCSLIYNSQGLEATEVSINR